MKCINTDREEYLLRSVDCYLHCLEIGKYNTTNMTASNELQNTCVFRFVSLWTQNSSNKELNKIVKLRLFKIGTYKFRVLLHQLAARMSHKNLTDANEQQHFQTNLIELMIKITYEHPYHVLPIILAFSNSHKDLTLTGVGLNSKESKAIKNDAQTKKLLITEDRVNTANYLLELIKSRNASLKAIIESTQQVCDAYIELANYKVAKENKENKDITFPKNLLINKIKKCSLVHVLTHPMPMVING